VLEVFQREIRQLLAREYEVSFPEKSTLVRDWSAERVTDQLDALLAADDVDFVIAFGALSSNEAVRRSLLPKPVLVPFVIDPQRVPLRDPRTETGRPGRCGLSRQW